MLSSHLLYRLCPGMGGNGVQWAPKATVLAQGLCLAGQELDPCCGGITC